MMEDRKPIEMIVVALCADYGRRADEIAKKELPPRVIMEYKYYNTKIYHAVAEIVGEGDAIHYIGDIGSRRGYSKQYNELYMSEATYNRRKRECKYNIARALNLIA